MADPPLDYRAIDDTIHGRVRLATMAYLSGAECADFADLARVVRRDDQAVSIELAHQATAAFCAATSSATPASARSRSSLNC